MKASSATAFSSAVSTGCPCRDDDRAVVHRVLEDRAREHDPVEHRDREAGGNPGRDGALSVRLAAEPDVHAIADAGVKRRDHERLFSDEAEVRDERRIEHLLDRRAVVGAPLQRAHARARRRGRMSTSRGHGERSRDTERARRLAAIGRSRYNRGVSRPPGSTRSAHLQRHPDLATPRGPVGLARDPRRPRSRALLVGLGAPPLRRRRRARVRAGAGAGRHGHADRVPDAEDRRDPPPPPPARSRRSSSAVRPDDPHCDGARSPASTSSRSSTSSRRRGCGSCGPPTRSGAASSATCTTAPSSGSRHRSSPSDARSEDRGDPDSRRWRTARSASSRARSTTSGARPRSAPAAPRARRARVGAWAGAGRSSIPGRARRAAPSRLPEAIEVAAYYVCAEAATNTIKHAQASRCG